MTRADLLEVVGRIERRGAFSIAEKVRTWLNQMFEYAVVKVPGLEQNPAASLHVIAMPQPPVRNNPFLRMFGLPAFLRRLHQYGGRPQTVLGVRLLPLTGVRTGELRLATPDQFHLDDGLRIIQPEVVKQRRSFGTCSIRSSRRRPTCFLGRDSLKKRISENTLNSAIKRMGYQGRLTGHGIRATISTALNEVGYPERWWMRSSRTRIRTRCAEPITMPSTSRSDDR